jgi:hypothetical protein
MVRDERVIAQRGGGRCCVPDPTGGWAQMHPWPIVGLGVDVPLPNLELGAGMP